MDCEEEFKVETIGRKIYGTVADIAAVPILCPCKEGKFFLSFLFGV